LISFLAFLVQKLWPKTTNQSINPLINTFATGWFSH